MKKTRMMKVDELLFLILKECSLPDDKWSRTGRKWLRNYAKAVYGEEAKKIIESYDLAQSIIRKDKIASEVIKNCDQ